MKTKFVAMMLATSMAAALPLAHADNPPDQTAGAAQSTTKASKASSRMVAIALGVGVAAIVGAVVAGSGSDGGASGTVKTH